jgi:hypothetical protein
MSASCCGGNAKFDGLDPRYKRALWTVIAINAGMFLVEIVAGMLAGSQALQADALDFLGDTLTYAISLAVIGMSLRVRATAALAKGTSLTLMGLWVFGSTAYHVRCGCGLRPQSNRPHPRLHSSPRIPGRSGHRPHRNLDRRAIDAW